MHMWFITNPTVVVLQGMKTMWDTFYHLNIKTILPQKCSYFFNIDAVLLQGLKKVTKEIKTHLCTCMHTNLQTQAVCAQYT